MWRNIIKAVSWQSLQRSCVLIFTGFQRRSGKEPERPIQIWFRQSGWVRQHICSARQPWMWWISPWRSAMTISAIFIGFFRKNMGWRRADIVSVSERQQKIFLWFCIELPVFCRWHAGFLLETGKKEAAAAEWQLIADLWNRHMCTGQEKLGFFCFFLPDIVVDAFSHHILEFVGKIIFGVPKPLREKRDG